MFRQSKCHVVSSRLEDEVLHQQHWLQGTTLAGILANLAAPLASAVAQLENITTQELEEDSWLKEGASKVVYLSRKLLECGALQAHAAAPNETPQELASTFHGSKEHPGEQSASDKAPGEQPRCPLVR
jgi:hypothetical protein